MILRKDIELTRKGRIVFGTLGVLLILIPSVWYTVSLKQKREKELPFLEKVTSKEAEEEAKDLVSEVGKLIDLPTDEVPSLATVTNVKQLREQEFYKNALDGDRVLIYQKAHMAYLYRPSTRKLVSVMPAVFEAEQNIQQPGLEQVASASDAASLATPSGVLEPTISLIQAEE